MSNPTTISGMLDAKGLKIAILATRFNDFIVDRLTGGALDYLERHGLDAKNITIVRIPGAFEMPLVCQKLAASGKYDGIVALGAVIRGATPHFDYVCNEASKGIAQVMLQYKTPIGFGLLTCDSIEQAIERAGSKGGNKGVEAAASMSKGKSASRRGERAQAFQVLYGLSFADATSLEDVRRAFLQSPDHQETEEGELPSGFAWDLVQGVWSRRDELDKTISRFSRNWRVDRMGRVELTLLRLAMYELLYRQDVPAKVAINEALELTRQFGEDNATSFVNGILDAAAKALEKGSLSAGEDSTN